MSLQTTKGLSKIVGLTQVSKAGLKALKERKSTKLSSEVTEDDSEKLPDVAPDDDEVFEPTPIPEEPEEGKVADGEAKTESGDAKTPLGSVGVETKTSPTTEAPKEEIIKRGFAGFRKFATEMDTQKPKDDSGPSTPKRKEALVQQYYALMKEKRDLRKRNAQAQTNICQYLRKHNIDLFSHMGADKSQGQLREEYAEMVDRIEELADFKDEETQQFEDHMKEINGKKTLLQNEITRLNTEMSNVKVRTVNQPQLDKPAIHAMSQKEVVDNVKYLESLEQQMQPIRLEYVQLKRALDAIQIKYDNVLYEHEEDLDQTELTVENQVLSDKMLETEDELARMQHVMNNDVVVLTHVKMKHTQLETVNTKMFMEAQAGAHKIKELKQEECRLKKIKHQLEEKYLTLQENIGLLGNKALLKDYSDTFIDLDRAQGRVELEIPLSPQRRKKKKITKSA